MHSLRRHGVQWGAAADAKQVYVALSDIGGEPVADSDKGIELGLNNKDGGGMFEPVHGSAPDIAGSGTANPLAAILSAAMLLRQTYSLELEARPIEDSVESVLEKGMRTPDLDRGTGPTVGTETIGSAVSHHILEAQIAE